MSHVIFTKYKDKRKIQSWMCLKKVMEIVLNGSNKYSIIYNKHNFTICTLPLAFSVYIYVQGSTTFQQYLSQLYHEASKLIKRCFLCCSFTNNLYNSFVFELNLILFVTRIILLRKRLSHK